MTNNKFTQKYHYWMNMILNTSKVLIHINSNNFKWHIIIVMDVINSVSTLAHIPTDDGDASWSQSRHIDHWIWPTINIYNKSHYWMDSEIKWGTNAHYVYGRDKLNFYISLHTPWWWGCIMIAEQTWPLNMTNNKS